MTSGVALPARLTGTVAPAVGAGAGAGVGIGDAAAGVLAAIVFVSAGAGVPERPAMKAITPTAASTATPPPTARPITSPFDPPDEDFFFFLPAPRLPVATGAAWRDPAAGTCTALPHVGHLTLLPACWLLTETAEKHSGHENCSAMMKPPGVPE
jgi:hypothetical protein